MLPAFGQVLGAIQQHAVCDSVAYPNTAPRLTHTVYLGDVTRQGRER